MSVHRFPARHADRPVAEQPRPVPDLSSVPRPPVYAVRQLDACRERFMRALALETHGSMMTPDVLRQARLDLARYPQFVRFRSEAGFDTIDSDDLNGFLHYATGYPRAWIVSWQMHEFVDGLEALGTDMSTVAPGLGPVIGEIAALFDRGLNREL